MCKRKIHIYRFGFRSLNWAKNRRGFNIDMAAVTSGRRLITPSQTDTLTEASAYLQRIQLALSYHEEIYAGISTCSVLFKEA